MEDKKLITKKTLEEKLDKTSNNEDKELKTYRLEDLSATEFVSYKPGSKEEVEQREKYKKGSISFFEKMKINNYSKN